MYADNHTDAIKHTIQITHDRRKVQQEYNEKNNITPKTIVKAKIETVQETFGFVSKEITPKDKKLKINDLEKKIKECEISMKNASKNLDFEQAAHFRDQMRYYQELEMQKFD